MLNGQRSNYEKNIYLQPELIREILDAPLPVWMRKKPRRMFFVGIGTNFHAAKISEWLWRRHASPEAWAVHSFDFVRTPQPVQAGDTVVVLSHRGTKSFSVEAAKAAGRMKAETIALTGRGSPWEVPLTHRLETCEQEDAGAFTKSLTTTLAWIARWIDSPELISGMRRACDVLSEGPDFPDLASASECRPNHRLEPADRALARKCRLHGRWEAAERASQAELFFLGDGVREWIANEISLKVQETAYLRTRAFGLEQFLHGPRISVGTESLVIAFSSQAEPRWGAVRESLLTVGASVLEVQSESLGLLEDGGWLWQLFWGQRLALDICRRLRIDPDALRSQDYRFRLADEALTL